MISPLRIDLRLDGDIILILKGGVLQPFKIVSHDTQNRKVNGVWILTDTEDNVKGEIPTLTLTEEWVDIYLEGTEEEAERLKKKISVLTNIKEGYN